MLCFLWLQEQMGQPSTLSCREKKAKKSSLVLNLHRLTIDLPYTFIHESVKVQPLGSLLVKDDIRGFGGIDFHAKYPAEKLDMLNQMIHMLRGCAKSRDIVCIH